MFFCCNSDQYADALLDAERAWLRELALALALAL
jgi:hypothetical protein